jgi:hypothetical protein
MTLGEGGLLLGCTSTLVALAAPTLAVVLSLALPRHAPG